MIAFETEKGREKSRRSQQRLFENHTPDDLANLLQLATDVEANARDPLGDGDQTPIEPKSSKEAVLRTLPGMEQRRRLCDAFGRE